MPQLRQNLITEEWVVIAPERAKRPSDYIIPLPKAKAIKKPCVFCVGQSAWHTRIKKYSTHLSYLIPNKFPVFLEDAQKCSVRTIKTEHNFFSIKAAMGGHDVLITKKHDSDIYSFNEETWFDLFDVAKKRYSYWRNDCNAVYSMLIYNHGSRAGASIEHPHSQIVASNIVPNQVQKEINGSQKYYTNNGVCVFCDLIAHEKKQKARIIYEDRRFIAFTFYAARFPYEIWLLPKVHQSHFENEGVFTFKSLSSTIKQVVGKLGKTLKNPPLNFYIHDSPPSLGETSFYHWHLEITPRVSLYGGYELGSGVIIDVQSPEKAAEYLNER